jgi:hypothetical protein
VLLFHHDELIKESRKFHVGTRDDFEFKVDELLSFMFFIGCDTTFFLKNAVEILLKVLVNLGLWNDRLYGNDIATSILIFEISWRSHYDEPTIDHNDNVVTQ